MENLLTDSHFWLILAFVTIILLLFKKILFHVKAFLDNKIDNVKGEIEESENTLSRAFSMLNERTKELSLSESNNKEEILNAQQKADSYYEQAINSLSIQIKNSKSSFATYIANEEKTLNKNLQQLVIEKSVDKAVAYLSNNEDSNLQRRLIQNSIDSIPELMQRNNS